MYTDSDTRKNIRLFYSDVTMPGGYAFNHPGTIKRTDNYYNGKFESGEFDSKGFKKFFYNITKPACDIATKFVDLDTKDILLISEKADQELKVWAMQKDLRHWMKKNNFGKLLNDIAYDFPKYGSVVVKKSKDGGVKQTALHNLRMDPTVSELKDSSFVYEVLNMTIREIESMGWDAEAVKELRATGEKSFVVYECYNYNSEEGKQWERTFWADLFCYRKDGGMVRGKEANINNEQESYVPGKKLYTDYTDDLPYRELHWEKVPGRWLGYGFPEYLVDNQVRRNELANVKAKGLLWTSLKLYQTNDSGLAKNVLTEMENGDIIFTNSEVKPVINEERNLSVFQQEEATWDKNSDQKTFSQDISRGANLPSRTPLGVANLSAGMVASYFDVKKENFGIFLRFLVLNDIIPSFKLQSAKEHTLVFLGSDQEIDKLDRMLSQYHTEKAAMEYAEKTGFFPEPEEMASELDRVSRELKTGRGRYLQIPAGYYDNAEYYLDVVTTGEQVDLGGQTQILQTVLQLTGTNPMILRDKPTRSMLFKLMELGGISPIDLNIIGDQADNAPPAALPQGGSVATQPQGQPQMMQQPQMVP